MDMRVPQLRVKMLIILPTDKSLSIEADDLIGLINILSSPEDHPPLHDLYPRDLRLIQEVTRKVAVPLEEVLAIVKGVSNDQFLRQQAVRLGLRFTQTALAIREFYDARVTCDETNNPPGLIDSGGFCFHMSVRPTLTLLHVVYELLIE